MMFRSICLFSLLFSTTAHPTQVHANQAKARHAQSVDAALVNFQQHISAQ